MTSKPSHSRETLVQMLMNDQSDLDCGCNGEMHRYLSEFDILHPSERLDYLMIIDDKVAWMRLTVQGNVQRSSSSSSKFDTFLEQYLQGLIALYTTGKHKAGFNI